MSEDDLRRELERLKAENEALKTRGSQKSGLKVSEKGGVSVYGLGRFPVGPLRAWAARRTLSRSSRTIFRH